MAGRLLNTEYDDPADAQLILKIRSRGRQTEMYHMDVHDKMPPPPPQPSPLLLMLP